MDSYTTDTSTPESKLANRATDKASSAIRSSQAMAQTVLNRVADGVQDARAQALPVIDRVSDQADSVARRSIETLRDRSAQVRERAVRASDITTTYIQQEPYKAVLFAAAAGAVLMALVGLSSRRSD